ncbi:BTAD domain-containing putative transcriptional regulator [Nonomuraea sp. NPDC048882]|uniref:AfsR/SARP family transcriptional regulator n=1 Tax=Nonomuraea sp. NPDC048882 TaxID=3154347 RepID=UPI0033D4B7D1
MVPKEVEVLVFRVLGPLEVERDGTALAIAASKQRIVLATLLLHANRYVSMERLIDRLWYDGGPYDPRSSLHTHMARLRHTLGDGRDEPGLIETSQGGYLLRACPESLDLLRFRRLVAEATQDQGHAEGLLQEALGLWRGALLGDVPSDVLHREEVPTLAAEHMSVQERWFDLALRSGQGAQVIGELRAALSAFPLSERLCTQLMLCLYQSGRPAEALEAYEAVRGRLRQELGLEPSQEMRQVQALVLHQQPIEPAHLGITREDAAPGSEKVKGSAVMAVAADRSSAEPDPSPLVGRLPADAPTFTGRTGEAKSLISALDQLGVAAIAGPGGVGKSALAIHVTHRIASRFPDGQLYVNLHGATPDVPALTPREALGRVLYAMGAPASAIPDEVEGAANLFRSMTRGKRLFIVLDNARDAGQVRPLLPGDRGCGVLVTSRRMLSSLDGVRHLQLDVLPEGEAHTLLGRLLGTERLEAEPEASAEVVRRCGGLPLALHIVAARLAIRPDWPISAMASRLQGVERWPGSGEKADDQAIRASFMVSYQDLLTCTAGGSAARMFRLLGLFDGHDIGVRAAAALADVPAVQAERLLELLADAQLVQTYVPGRYRMHDLLRLFARERAAEERDAADAVRRLLDFYLATARHAVGALSRSQLWRAEVGPALSPHDGIALRTREEALSWTDTEGHNLVTVVRQAAGSRDDDVTVALAAALSYVLFTRGRWRQELRICETAMEAAIRSGNPLYLAIIHQNLGTALSASDRMADAVPHLEKALRAYRQVGVPRHEATLLDDLGSAMCREGRYAESIDYHRQALRIHRQLGNRLGAGITLTNLGLVHQRIERFHDASRLHNQAIAVFQAADNSRLHAAALGNLAEACRLAGWPERATGHFEQALDLDRRAGHGGSYGYAERLWGLGQALHDLGKIHDARGYWDKAADILHDLGLISASDKHDIQTSAAPETPEVIQRQL